MTNDIVASSTGITGTPEHVDYVTLQRKYRKLSAELAELRQERDAAIDREKQIVAVVRAERNAALERERVLRETVDAYPEWLETYNEYVCLVCHSRCPKVWTGTGNPPKLEHFSNCLRQRVKEEK